MSERATSEAETIAKAFHTAYERLAPKFAYDTRSESAVPWQQVPERNRRLMIATVQRLLDNGVIRGRARCIYMTPTGRCSLPDGHRVAHRRFSDETGRALA